mgnify:CR=1 FL=1
MSKLRKTFKYRLYPNRAQVVLLERQLVLCCEVYNAALQERRDAWRMGRNRISFPMQSAQLPLIKGDCSELREVYSQVLQDVLHRVDKAFDGFFRRAKRGETPGFPRFRSRRRYDSLTYPQLGFSLEGNYLALTKVGVLKVKLHRPLEGTVKTLTLKRECGKWYALFSCEVETAPLLPSDKAVGIDLGLESFLTTSDGEHVENPRHLRQAEFRLVKAQQRVSQRKKGGNRRRKAVRLLARQYQKVRNCRKDFHHKTARELVQSYGFIAAEDLRIRNMVQNGHLSKSISDAGWGQFVSILQAKAEWAGREVVLVNPRNTSQVCSRCGAHVSKPLSERVHSCPICGLFLHRDVNAARNILALGRSVQVKS